MIWRSVPCPAGGAEPLAAGILLDMPVGLSSGGGWGRKTLIKVNFTFPHCFDATPCRAVCFTVIERARKARTRPDSR